MMSESHPIDYIVAAIVYMIYDDKSLRGTISVNKIMEMVNRRYGASIPKRAIGISLDRMTQDGLAQASLDLSESRSFIFQKAEFDAESARWRYEGVGNAAKILDTFMNSGYDWMDKQLQSSDFVDELDDYLNPQLSTSRSQGDAVLDKDASAKVIAEVAIIQQQLHLHKLTNTQTAQVQALLQSALVLAAAPEAPRDLIWLLIDRANQIAGIAGLFLAIYAVLK